MNPLEVFWIKISIKTEDGYIKTSDTQNFEDFLVSLAIGQTGVNHQPLMSRDKYGFGMDLYELPTLIIYPFDDEEETTSGKANGVQITFDLGKKTLYFIFI